MKSKRERQHWWRSLSAEERGAFIDKQVRLKAKRRRQRSIKIMRQYGQQYKCSECFHGKVGCCKDRLPNGCEYWYNPNAAQPFGIKLRQQKKVS